MKLDLRNPCANHGESGLGAVRRSPSKVGLRNAAERMSRQHTDADRVGSDLRRLLAQPSVLADELFPACPARRCAAVDQNLASLRRCGGGDAGDPDHADSHSTHHQPHGVVALAAVADGFVRRAHESQMGQVTLTVENLQQVNPDASWFAVPSGFQLNKGQ